jgi:hypothetical protein
MKRFPGKLFSREVQTCARLSSVCSRTASTCSRLTPGNQSRNSSTVAPASRFSKSAFTGTRVPLNTHAPLTLSGARSTAGHWLQSSRDTMIIAGMMSRKSYTGGCKSTAQVSETHRESYFACCRGTSLISTSTFSSESRKSASHRSWSGIFATRCGSEMKSTPRDFKV